MSHVLTAGRVRGLVCLKLWKQPIKLTFPTGPSESSFLAETSFVKAPLNSRVGSSSYANPKAPSGKGKSKAETLDHIPIEIQEAMILEDLLFVLMVCYRNL